MLSRDTIWKDSQECNVKMADEERRKSAFFDGSVLTSLSLGLVLKIFSQRVYLQQSIDVT